MAGVNTVNKELSNYSSFYVSVCVEGGPSFHPLECLIKRPSSPVVQNAFEFLILSNVCV